MHKYALVYFLKNRKGIYKKVKPHGLKLLPLPLLGLQLQPTPPPAWADKQPSRCSPPLPFPPSLPLTGMWGLPVSFFFSSVSTGHYARVATATDPLCGTAFLRRHHSPEHAFEVTAQACPCVGTTIAVLRSPKPSTRGATAMDV
jgi:hypothetical protein